MANTGPVLTVRPVGILFLVLAAAILIICGFYPPPLDFLFEQTSYLYQLILQNPAPVSPTMARWYYAGALINALSVFCAIVIVLRKNGYSKFDIWAAFTFGVFATVIFLSLLLVKAPFYDFNIITAIIISVYAVFDIVGLKVEDVSQRPNYWLPLWCLDAPGATVSWYFVVVYRNGGIDEEFYRGVGAALMVIGAAGYVTLTTMVLGPETTVAPAQEPVAPQKPNSGSSGD